MGELPHPGSLVILSGMLLELAEIKREAWVLNGGKVPGCGWKAEVGA